MARYYVVLGLNNRWRASTEHIWGIHKFRKVVNASTSRSAISKAKKAYGKKK